MTIQKKPFNVITLGQREADYIKQMITIAKEYDRHIAF
jgi:hypothetical protein